MRSIFVISFIWLFSTLNLYAVGHRFDSLPPPPHQEIYQNLYNQLITDYTDPALERQILDVYQKFPDQEDTAGKSFFRFLLFSYYTLNDQSDRADSLAEQTFRFFRQNGYDKMLLQLHIDYGCALNAWQRYDEALPLLRKGILLTRDVPDSKIKAELLAETAFSFLGTDQYDSVHVYNQLALEAAEAIPDTLLMIHAYNKSGLAYKRQFALNRSLDYYRKALELNDLFGDAEQGRVLVNNIATLYTELKRNKEAVEMGRRMFTYYPDQAQDPQQVFHYTIAYSSMSTLLNNDSLFQNALDTARLAQKNLRHPLPNGLKMVVYYNLANSFAHLNETDSTLFYLREAEKMVPGSRNLKDVANLYYLCGEQFNTLGRYREAAGYLEKSIGIYQTLSSHNTIYIEALLKLSKIEGERFGNYPRAYALSWQAVKLIDEFNRADFNKKSAGFEVEFNTKEKELEISRLQTRQLEEVLKYQRSRIVWGCIVLACCLLIVGLIWYERLRRIRRANREAQIRQQMYISGLEQEKERMSKELHDGICNKLLTLELGFRELRDQPHRNRIKEIREEVRLLSHELALPAFSEVSLTETLLPYLDHLRSIDGISLHLYMDDSLKEIRLKTNVQSELYRIVQEGVTNMLRHAHASNFYFTLTCSGNSLDLIMEDDGVGFNPESVKHGLGMILLKKRVESIKGELRIESAVGKGTLIHTVITID